MFIEVLGPRGVGKTLLGKSLQQELSLPYISLGDLSRKEIREQTPYGKKMEQYINSGQGYPKKFLTPLIEQTLKNNNNIIFDGFPRQIYEADEFTELLTKININIDLIIRLETSLDIIKNRVKNRIICNKCGLQGDKETDFCCKNYLSRRTDDNASDLEKSFNHYKETIVPIMHILTANTFTKILLLNGEKPPVFLVQSVLANLR